ncbi:MAG: DUF3784 domain-containing protein [Ruminococcaceae bacterium]|nr:DUF3784 domain-containing protein [Oscillospiraceae bacterium]
MENIISSVIFALISLMCFIISILQFSEKGFLFNNSYIYASKDERENMNKTPYYRQTGIIFIFLGIIFLINSAEMILETGWLSNLVLPIVLAAIIYAVVSTIIIERKN